MNNKDFNELCKLSQLELAPEQIKCFSVQLNNMLTMVEHLPDISDNIKPVDDFKEMILREDDITPSLERDVFLAAVPKHELGYISLPPLKY